jgi:hypothetical protein
MRMQVTDSEEVVMDSYLNDLPNGLVIGNIWPHILKICPFIDMVKALQNLRIVNKVWKQLID